LAFDACRLVKHLKTFGREPDGEQNCLLKKELKAASTVTLSNPSVGQSFSMYTILERERQLTLAGEGGKIVGVPDYWSSIKDHLVSNRDRSFSIFSLGGGQGFDAKSIEGFFKEERGLNVTQALSIDTNPLAYWMNQQEEGPVRIQDVFDFLTTLLPREENELRVFHLGNFLSILSPEVGVRLLQKLYSKMEKGDIVSILCIRSEHFEWQRSVRLIENSQKKGMQGYSREGTFFRTARSEPKEFSGYLKELGFSIYSLRELPPQDLDSGPNNYKMFFVVLIALKQEH